MSFPTRNIRALALLPLACAAISASAQTNYWTSSSDTNWSNPANWSLGSPATGQTLEIGAAGYAQPASTTLDSGNYSVANLLSNSFLNMIGGSLGLASLGAASQINGLSVGSSTLSVSGNLTVAKSLSNAGTINVMPGGSLSSAAAGIVNSGTLSVSSEADFTNGYSQSGADALTHLNYGTLDLEGNTLTLGAAGDGGLLNGEGSISGSVDNAGGLVVPGRAQAAEFDLGHILNIQGDYTQGASGATFFDLENFPGPPYFNNKVIVSGNLNLQGTIDIASDILFDGTYADLEFPVFEYGGSATISDSLRLVDQGYLNVKFSLFAVPNGNGGGVVYLAAPEPPGLLVVAVLGVLPLARCRRRPKSK